LNRFRKTSSTLLVYAIARMPKGFLACCRDYPHRALIRSAAYAWLPIARELDIRGQAGAIARADFHPAE